jgi:hypothetical protein
MAEYMNCGTDDERSDFFAFNDYSWCDPSSFTISGWDQKVKNFTGYGLPLFLSEYGCNTNKRQFQEVGSLYDTQMTPVYSGGLVYEYSEEGSNYGLVKISGNDVTEKSDYTELKNALKKSSPPKGDGNYNSTGGASGCPASSPPNWDVSQDALPEIPAPAKKFLTEGAGKGPGFLGSGSQNKGTQSTATASAGSGSVSGSSATSSSSPSSSTGAAVSVRAPEMSFVPLMGSVAVALSTLLGASFVLL